MDIIGEPVTADGMVVGTAAALRAVNSEQVPEPLVGFLERDELTGLLGWRGLQRALRALSSADAESPFAVALADVDAFSLVNETYGYDVGDEVLRQGMHLLGGLVCGRPA